MIRYGMYYRAVKATLNFLLCIGPVLVENAKTRWIHDEYMNQKTQKLFCSTIIYFINYFTLQLIQTKQHTVHKILN